MVSFAAFTFVILVVVWIVILSLIRRANFNADGTPRFPRRGTKEGGIRSSEIEYHNKAIYRDFELFLKISMTIIGGVILIAIKSIDIKDENLIAFLLNIGGKLLFLVSILFSIFVILHQKSKIERWEQRYTWLQTLSWQECWMVVVMLLIGFVFAFNIIPEIVNRL